VIGGYTALAVLGVGVTLGLETVLRTGLLRDRRFWIALVIVGFFQLLVDGWLTCRPIVTYAERAFSSVRAQCPQWEIFARGGAGLGMPLEDLAFGFALATQTLLWWVWWGRRTRASSVSGRGAEDHSEKPAGTGPSRPD
jgi:lycopene cyclase domain-containing protein